MLENISVLKCFNSMELEEVIHFFEKLNLVKSVCSFIYCILNVRKRCRGCDATKAFLWSFFFSSEIMH